MGQHFSVFTEFNFKLFHIGSLTTISVIPVLLFLTKMPKYNCSETQTLTFPLECFLSCDQEIHKIMKRLAACMILGLFNIAFSCISAKQYLLLSYLHQLL
jgi:hypothetical protein